MRPRELFVPEVGRRVLINWLDKALLCYFIVVYAYITFVAINLEESSSVVWLVMLSALLRATRFRIEVDRDGLEIVNFFSTHHVAWSEILHVTATFYGLRLSLAGGETVMALGITRPSVSWKTKADRVADFINSEVRKRHELIR